MFAFLRGQTAAPFRQTALVLVFLVALGAPAAAADFNVADYGARGGGVAADTAAVQRAIDACSAQGGGRVVVPAGPTLVVGTVVLKSHVELHLERGAVLKGSPHPEDFSRFSTQPVWFDAGPPPKLGVILYAEGAEDIALTGDGTLDGNGGAYVLTVGPSIYTCPLIRPFSVVLKDCRHVLVRDVTLLNSAFWTLRLLGCDEVSVDSVRINGDMKMPNNDGIDVDWSSNVRIRNCAITTGDDCISLKTAPLSGGITRPCENVIVSGCTLTSRSTGVVVGCDVAGEIRDVIVTDCVIKDSHRGVAVRLSLDGSIEHIFFSNLVIETRIFDSAWWGRGEPIQVLALPWTKSTRLGVIRDIRFANLDCRSENGAVIYAAEPGHIQNLSFDRVSLRIDRPAAYAGGQQDLRPNPGVGLPAMETAGFLMRHADGVTFRDCAVTWGPNPPEYFRHALEATDCPRLSDSGLTGLAAHPGLQAKQIR